MLLMWRHPSVLKTWRSWHVFNQDVRGFLHSRVLAVLTLAHLNVTPGWEAALDILAKDVVLTLPRRVRFG